MFRLSTHCNQNQISITGAINNDTGPEKKSGFVTADATLTRPSGRTLDENVFKQFVMETTDNSNASLLLDRDYNPF